MTIAEKRHERLEEQTARRLEDQGLSLHRQGGLYQVIDGDMQAVTEIVSLSEIVGWLESW